MDRRCDDRSGAGYDCYPDSLPKRPVIEPGRLSDYYPVVYIRVVHPPTDDAYRAYGCEYVYDVQGVRHEQRTPCQFSIKPTA